MTGDTDDEPVTAGVARQSMDPDEECSVRKRAARDAARDVEGARIDGCAGMTVVETVLSPYRTLTDRELLDAIRANDPKAFTEFVTRFQPPLSERARGFGLRPPESDELVSDVLGDVALHLAHPRTPTPRSLVAYLVDSLRHRLLNVVRARTRRSGHEESETEGGSDAWDDSAMLATTSQGSLDACRGPGWEAQPLSSVLERLAAALDDDLTAEERQLLMWTSHHATLREIAEALGITRAGAKSRLWRLRERLKAVAIAYAEEVGNVERRELLHFFRRTAAMARYTVADANPAPEILARRVAERPNTRTLTDRGRNADE